MNDGEMHSVVASPVASSIYELGEHVLEVTDHEGIEISSQSVSLLLSQDEAYRLSILLHMLFL